MYVHTCVCDSVCVCVCVRAFGTCVLCITYTFCLYNNMLYMTGDEGATPDDKPGGDDDKATGDDDKPIGDDIPLGEPVDDTHSTSVAADNIVQAEECIDDGGQPQLLPPAVSISDAASPVPDHSPVPVTSPAQSPAHTPPPSPPPELTAAIVTIAPDAVEADVTGVQGMYVV